MKIHFKTAIPRRNYDYEPYDSNGDPKQLDKQGFSTTQSAEQQTNDRTRTRNEEQTDRNTNFASNFRRTIR